MNQKRLNDELTVVGLVLVLLFTSYYLASYVSHTSHLQYKVQEAQKTAILLDKRLTQTEHSLEATNKYLEELQSTLDNYSFLDKVIKDIDRNWSEQKWYYRTTILML